MSETLNTFLENHRVFNKTDKYNYISMDKGKFMIEDKEKLYELIVNTDNGRPLVEHTKDSFKLFFDIDTVDEDNIIAKAIESSIEKHFVNPDPECLIAKNNEKEKYHLVYPNIIVNKKIYKQLVRNINKSISNPDLEVDGNCSSLRLLYCPKKDSNTIYEPYNCDLKGVEALKAYSIINDTNEPLTKCTLNMTKDEKEKVKSKRVADDREKLELLYLLSLLNESQKEDYEVFRNICFLCSDYGIPFDYVDSLFNVGKYDTEGRKRFWDNLSEPDGSITIRSAHHYAKESNRGKYDEWLLFSNLKPLEYDIAVYVKNLAGNTFICVGNSTFYHFNGKKWIHDEGCTYLRTFIHEKVVQTIKNTIYELKYFEGYLESFEDIMEPIESLLNWLCKTINVNNVITEMSHLVKDCTLLEKLDENKGLIAFENGIYDLNNSCFRDAKYDDYCSLSVGYNYEPDKNDKKTEVLTFLQKVFPEESKREYLLVQFANMLSGLNQDQLVHLHTGRGSNGKSLLTNLLAYVFGEYAHSLPSSYLTALQDDPSRPDPLTLSLKSKRYVYSQEPEKKQKLNSGTLKIISGGDELSARQLYSGRITKFTPQLSLHLSCNMKPEIDGNDGGLQRRIRVVEYKSHFVHIPKHEGEYLIDTSLNSKIKEWRCSFMNILLEYYGRELQCPESIAEASKTYLTDNNEIIAFCDEYLEKKDGAFVTMKELKSAYYEAGYGKKSLDELRNTFIQYMNTDMLKRKRIDGVDYRSVFMGWQKTREAILC